MNQHSEIFRDGLLKGKRALVTGGGTGIGRAIALEFARLGADVAITSRSLEKLEPTAKEIEALGVKCFCTTCDIREFDRVGEMTDEVMAALGGIDILVNNAGGQFPSPAEGISRNGWFAVINNNLNGTWYVTQTVAKKAMIGKGGGNIVNIVADMWRGFPGMVHTGAARAGVVNFTQTLAVEWAQHKIRINALAPGVIFSTGMRNYPPSLWQEQRKQNPLMRLGSVEDCAYAVVYLASKAGHFITGETIRVDGGASLWGDGWFIPDHADESEIPKIEDLEDLR